MDSGVYILDIKEKEVAEPQAPSFPQPKSSSTGFPEPKKRNRVSAFKQKRAGLIPEDVKTQIFATSGQSPILATSTPPSKAPASKGFESNDRQRIDQENNERLASMSPQEIEQARQELFSNLDPNLLQMLLKRASLDEPSEPSPFDPPTSSKAAAGQSEPAPPPPEIKIEDVDLAPPKPAEASITPTLNPGDESEASPEEDQRSVITPQPTSSSERPNVDETAPAVPPEEHIIHPDEPKPHFPQPRQPPDLDPSDPDFLANLHQKYFPSLPADPSKLAWMAPIPTPNSPADFDSPYHPSQSSLPISALRFDFRGTLLPPRISRVIPTTKGLHHHGEAPEAAGYTVKELARLCRSAVPGQRCLAYQTLGRILYKLGLGAYGRPGDGVADGIWAGVMEGQVLESLYEEAGKEEGAGHRSARAYAIEAVWLWEKGGWKERVKRGK